jgi:error-prone DNA polymerase
VLAVDVLCSDWEATLEITENTQPAVRLGMNLVRGLPQEAAWRIEEARAVRPFSDLRDLALRASLSSVDIQALAAADALKNLAGHRREALWHASTAAPGKGLLRGALPEPEIIHLPPPSDLDQTVSDYRTLGLTLGRHPLSFLRKQLLDKRFMTAEVLRTYQQGQFARACGIVTVRQRPATAKGTIFVTLEDETGNVNVIVWSSLIEQQRHELLNSSLLGVYGIWQTENNVNHLIAKRLLDLSSLLGTLAIESRDFT